MLGYAGDVRGRMWMWLFYSYRVLACARFFEDNLTDFISRVMASDHNP